MRNKVFVLVESGTPNGGVKLKLLNGWSEGE